MFELGAKSTLCPHGWFVEPNYCMTCADWALKGTRRRVVVTDVDRENGIITLSSEE